MNAIRRFATVLALFVPLVLPAIASAQHSQVGYPTIDCSSVSPPVKSGSDPATPGAWTDAYYRGTGWTLDFVGDAGAQDLYLYWFTYTQNNFPTWLESGGHATVATAANGATEYQAFLYSVTYPPGGTKTTSPLPVGSVSIVMTQGSTTNAAIKWQWDAVGATPNPDSCIFNTLKRSNGTGPVPDGLNVDESYTGIWNAGGQWGLAVQEGTEPITGNTDEGDYPLFYDTNGNAVWVLGSSGTGGGSPSASNASFSLDYYTSAYPNGFPTTPCTSSCNVVHSNVGTLTRSFSSTEAGTASLSIPTQTFAGRGSSTQTISMNVSNVAINKFTENDYVAVNEPYCVIPAGQTTCNVVVSWTSQQTTALVYRRNLTDDVLSITPLPGGSAGQYTDPLSAGADVQYEMRNGSPTGTLIFTSAEVVVPAAQGNTTPTSATPSIATTPTTTDTTSDQVGSTLAQFRVDEGGNSTYSIPIQVPPGTAGVAPKMALNYNSRFPTGVMGPGWSISGSSQITRCRQSREDGDFMNGTAPVDGNPPPIDFSSSDRFCLDGVRLLLLSNSPTAYGANTSTYSPENDPSTLVTATMLQGALDSFLVQRKDGTTSTYGYTAALAANNALATAVLNGTTVSVSWQLARLQDSAGNYIDFDYQVSPGSSLPFAPGAVETVLKSVNYTGHATTPVSATYASITFNYSTMSAANARMGFQGGLAFVQSQQLTSITVTDSSHASNGTFRYYKLAYQTSPSLSGYQEFTSLTECRDTTSAVCFLPTTFQWSKASYTFDASTTVQSAPGGTNFYQVVGYKIADLDGDGRQDLVWAVNDGKCGSNSSLYAGFLDRDANNQMTLVTTGATGQTQSATCAPINLQENDRAWYLIDYNGDGLADLMIGGAPSPGPTPTSHWSLYPGVGRAFTSTSTVFNKSVDLLAPGSLATPIWIPYDANLTAAVGVLADLNGDGLPDFIYPVGPTTAGAGGYYTMARLMVRKTDGTNGFTFSDPYKIDLNFVDGPGCYLSDGTCDADINIFYFDAAHHSAIAADVDGDGRADLTFEITFPSNTNTTNGVNPPPNGTNPPPPVQTASKGPIGGPIGDPRNDGVGSTYWYQFAVTSITPPTAQTPMGEISFTEYWDQPKYSSGGSLPDTPDKFYVVDLNGDGLADIFYQDATDTTGQTYGVLINTGTGYLPAVTVNGITNGNLLQFADINGDGKLDIIFPMTGSQSSFTYWYIDVVPSTATAWTFTSAKSLSIPAKTSSQWISLFGDLDGDGATDFLSLLTGSNTTSGNLYTTRVASATTCLGTTNDATCSRYRAHDVIVSFTNGNGAMTSLNYQPLTNNGVYQSLGGGGTAVTTAVWGYGSPVFNLLAPLYVVASVTSSAPLSGSAGATSWVYYRYEYARMQAGGRGFLGFQKLYTFDQNDLSTGGYVETVSNYYQEYPFIGIPALTSKIAHAGTFNVFGSPYDTCAANGPESAAGCFGKPTWNPNSGSTATVASTSSTVPACSGPGCTIPPATACSSPTAVVAYAEPINAFSPAAVAQPLFVYTQGTSDQTYDIVTVAETSQVSNYFCYDTSSPAAYENVLQTMTWTQDGSGATVAQKLVTNTYKDDTSRWFLGRLSNATTLFARPSLASITRSADFVYDPTTGILTQEELETGQDNTSNNTYVDLTTMYMLDSYGNRIAAYQCSSDIPKSSCTSSTVTTQQQSGATVHRYAKTTYDSIGRYSTGSILPFYSPSGLNEQTAVTINSRDEFGNVSQQTSINGISQYAVAGQLGRPYFTKDTTGKASTTTYRWCTSVSCPGDAKFRSQTITAGAPEGWTYYDVLGRPILKLSQSFDGDPSSKAFSAVCSYYDAHNRPITTSEPFFAPATEQTDGSPSFTTITPCSSAYATYATLMYYDVIGRVIRITNPDGGIIQRNYAGLVTTSSNPRNVAWVTTETRNALGEIISTSDATDSNYTSTTGLMATRKYDAAGDLVNLTVAGPTQLLTTTIGYDVLGRKTQLSDPDAGASTYIYNAAGDITSQKDANLQTVAQNYDAIGRRWKRTTSGGSSNAITDTWTYDASAGTCPTYHSCGMLVTESRTQTRSASFNRSFTYDGLGRLYHRSTSIAGSVFTETTAYDAFGRVAAQQDASGYSLMPAYTPSGFVGEQIDTRVGTVYQLLATSARGQPMADQRGGSSTLQSTTNYDPATGRVNSVCSGTSCSLQNLLYQFDTAGNLTLRERAVSAQPTIEKMTYDGENRLLQSQLTEINGVVQSTPLTTTSLVYDLLGNICNKNGTSYLYGSGSGCGAASGIAGAHAVTMVGTTAYGYDSDGNQTSGNGRVLTYNSLNQLMSAVKGAVGASFTYTPEGERFQRTDSSGTTTWYVGSVEVLRTSGVTNEYRRYLGSVAIDHYLIAGGSATNFVFGDHLGSLDVVTTSTGSVVETASFDAYGSLRNATTWHGTAVAPTTTTHGFTGQEEIYTLNLVHMNGRVYDPSLGRMLQVDPMTGPGNQSLNRYSYVVNNPLSLTDPTGYSWWGNLLRDAAAVAITVWAPYLAPEAWSAFEVDVAAGFLAGVVQSGNIQGGLYGAFSGGLFAGIGQAIPMASGSGVLGTNLSLGGYSARVLANGVAGGVMSSLEGGRFGSGFLSAGVSAAVSPTVRFLGPAAVQAVAISVIGGTTSAIAGGKFGNGAVTGAFSFAFGSVAQNTKNPSSTDERMQAWAAQSEDLTYALAFEPPAIPQWLLDGASGLGSVFSFGATDSIQDWMGTDDLVNRSSGVYQGAMAVGFVGGFVTGESEAEVVFQTGHYAPRLLAEGLDVAETEATVAGEVSATISSATEGTAIMPFSGRISINGTQVEYRAYALPNGTVSVGTIFVPKW